MPVPSTTTPLVGNRVALVGLVVYLLEWAVIVPVGIAGDFGAFEPGTRSAEEMAELYAASAGRTAFLAAWLGLVLMGRVLFVVGLRSAIRSTTASSPLADAAVAAMAVSVAVEVVAFGLVPAIGFAALSGADAALVAALDAVAGFAWLLVFPPVGAAVLLAALAMRASRAFPGWMSGLGIAAGAGGIAYGLLAATAHGAGGPVATAADVAGISFPVALAWMLATAVFLLRRAPGRNAPAA